MSIHALNSDPVLLYPFCGKLYVDARQHRAV